MKRCVITLKPYGLADSVSHMDIGICFDALECAEGERLCRMQICTVSIPGCVPEDFSVEDQQGAVGYRVSQETLYPYEYQDYYAARPLLGEVDIRYTIRPRAYQPGDTCGPYFDFKAESGGANTAGLSILPEFEGYTGEITLRWDMSAMPPGSKGVNTFGEGELTRRCAFSDMRNSYYAMGRLQSIGEEDFGFYWLAEPAFDVVEIAGYTKRLYSVMAPFFHDTESVYRIFLRKDPYTSSGGTALLRSYMLGWNDTQPVSVADKQNILAHEMVHNWPRLTDTPYGTATWYVEGAAEYYSIMLPLRAGLITKETALHEIQRRTDDYYTNPTRHMENIEAAKICWQDRRAQRIAYGRGFFFLANTDAKIREKTNGAHSIDDIVLGLLEKAGRCAPEELDNQAFFDAVRQVSGLDIRDDWELMRTGGHFAPRGDSFDGHFTVCEEPAVEADTGKPVTSYCWKLR